MPKPSRTQPDILTTPEMRERHLQAMIRHIRHEAMNDYAVRSIVYSRLPWWRKLLTRKPRPPKPITAGYAIEMLAAQDGE